MNKMLAFFLQMPRWYRYSLSALLVVYLLFWISTAQLLGSAYVHAYQLSTPNAFTLAVGGDSEEYAALSDSLLHGHFALPGQTIEYFRTPGYPGFIAGVRFLGGSYLGVTFLQLLMVFGIALMIRAIGMKFLTPGIGMLASLLFLLNPLVITLSLQIMSDISFTFLFLLGVTVLLFYLEKCPVYSVLLAGLLFSAASYIRPAGVVLLPIFIAPVLVASISWVRKFWSGVLLAGVFVLALLPWMLRNYQDSGVFAFSSLAAFNLTADNVPMFEATLHKDDPLTERTAIEKTLGIPLAQWRDLSVSPTLERYDRKMLLAEPVKYFVYHTFEAIGFFLNSGLTPLIAYMSIPFHYTIAPTPEINIKDLLIHRHFAAFIEAVTTPWWIFVERLFLAAGCVLMAVGLFVKRRSPLAWMASFIVLYTAELAGPVAEARYRIPVDPFTALLIAIGISAVWSFVHARRHDLQKR